MAVDYSEFLVRSPDGAIWWPVEIAAKLAAGFLPVDPKQDPNGQTLRPAGNLAQAEVRTILSYLAQPEPPVPPPLIIDRDEARIVRAGEFLAWLDRVSEVMDTASPTPLALKAAVTRACLEPVPPGPDGYASLMSALDGLFNLNLAQLPVALMERVQRDLHPMPWDLLSPGQRRIVAAQWDYQHDPATEPERTRAFELFCREYDIEADIRRWELIATPTALDLEKKEVRLASLNKQLAEIRAEQRELERGRREFVTEGRKKPEWRRRLEAEQTAGIRPGEPKPEFMPYMKAMAALRQRLNATPEELAAWIFMSPKDGGIAAYRNANEFDNPPRFHFGVPGEGAFDLVEGLMATWYLATDIATFAPADRFITGAALRARWQALPGIRVDAFIRAKLEESRLTPFHPRYGGTRWDHPQDERWPPEDLALFSMQEIALVEREDLGIESPADGPPVEHAAPPAESQLSRDTVERQQEGADVQPADLHADPMDLGESADERARRLYARHLELIAAKVKNPTAQLAKEENGITPGRIRQIIGPLRRAARERKASPFPFVPPKPSD